MTSATAKFHVVLNAGSGRDDANVARATIEGVLDEGGRSYEVSLVEEARSLPAVAEQVVATARAGGGIVVASGGDGTINAVAQAVVGSGCAFGVVPQGTFNFFGRTHGISQDAAEATRQLLDAHVELVQIGLINERVFLVNASVGLYPELIEDREAYTKRYGRSRLVAIWSGLRTVMRDHRPLRIRLERDGHEPLDLRTPTLVVGNNRLQLKRIGIPEAQSLEKGHLAAMIVRPVSTRSLVWLMLRGALGQLGEAGNVDSFSFRHMSVEPRSLVSRRMKVAVDGEVIWLKPPLEFQASPHALPLLVPSAEAAIDAT